MNFFKRRKSFGNDIYCDKKRRIQEGVFSDKEFFNEVLLNSRTPQKKEYDTKKIRKCICGGTPIYSEGVEPDSQSSAPYAHMVCDKCGYSVSLYYEEACFEKAATEWVKKMEYVEGALKEQAKNRIPFIDEQSDKKLYEIHFELLEEIVFTTKRYLKALKEIKNAHEITMENYSCVAFQAAAKDIENEKEIVDLLEQMIENYEDSLEIIEKLKTRE